MSWDLLNDDVRELIFKMKTTMEIEDKFKREHRDKMAEAFDLIKIRGNRMEFYCRMESYDCSDEELDKYMTMFEENEFEDYLSKYGETEDYESYNPYEDPAHYPLFMQLECRYEIIGL